ncbi:site-specific tyrosine recombinase XerC [Permianibacter aggregans]|uniref:Integrase/recombinase XerD n=1 Tax=Permianibacter aggregans TaxID=1510150 RepID=A0A4R6URJ7_9GAMM|nr:site-specific tyrosine recombinase XerC [Permianibacter aggregans]QGX39332.1 site-specific tyrosine recombinase XerC [Permianibacter aggregans]QGX39340.1 site-specific tyrosine recombinase XerC [Permianibacter aggregans]TDQ49928.1 integrase/recombinase XerD [Permianibacter aggregans]
MALRNKKKRSGEQIKKRDIRHSALAPYLALYLDYLRTRAYSDFTLTQNDANLRRFIEWCDERALQQPTELNRPIIERYQRHLHFYRKDNGEPLSIASQIQHLQNLRGWFKFLVREHYLPYNPAADLVMPRKPKRLPSQVLTLKQVQTILQQPDVTTLTGIRDRAILEVLYATGMRRTELTQLKRHHIDSERGTIFIEQGKGHKDRYVPIGQSAIEWLTRYLLEVRPHLILTAHEDTVFLTDYGEPLTKNRLSDLVKTYVLKAGIAHGSCHLFRHAMATHMLENGADIRFIQAMLGHSELTTTAIYTHVAVQKLKAVYDASHPTQLQRSAKDDLFDDLDAESEEE